MGRRLAGLRCRLRVMLERGRETTGMDFETHDRGGSIEDSKGECVREGRKNIPEWRCRCRCSGVKSHRKKSLVFTLVCLHTRMLNASADASASALGHPNKYTV